MLKTIEGVYRNGQIELLEQPDAMQNETRVIVTFLTAQAVDLQAAGFTREQAAELRARLLPFTEDWNQSAMDSYDDYDTAKAQL